MGSAGGGKVAAQGRAGAAADPAVGAAREIAELRTLVQEMRGALEIGRQDAEQRLDAVKTAYDDQLRHLQETCRALREALENEREAGRAAAAAAQLAFSSERQSLQATIVQLRSVLDTGR